MTSTTTEASLSAELWIKIFNNINSFQQLMECSLVNTRWQRLAGTVISSTGIRINTIENAEFVYNYLENNSEIRRFIRHLEFCLSDAMVNNHIGFFRRMLSLVVTQDLESLGGIIIAGTAFYELLLEQVASEEGLARFSNLKTIPPTLPYNIAYDRLLHHLRHNLKQATVQLWTPNDREDMPRFNTLYHLDSLTQLEALSVSPNLLTFQELESILNNCNPLSSLIILSGLDWIEHIDVKNVDQWPRSNTMQINTLTTLKISTGQRYNPHWFDYILYKYPNVNTIRVFYSLFHKSLGESKVPEVIGDMKSILGKIRGMHTYCLVLEQIAKENTGDFTGALTSDGYTTYETPDSLVVTNDYTYYVKNSINYETERRLLPIYNNTDM